MKLLNKIKANMVFSISPYDRIKSIWIGPLLITWTHDPPTCWYETLEFNWYGFDYWYCNEIEYELD